MAIPRFGSYLFSDTTYFDPFLVLKNDAYKLMMFYSANPLILIVSGCLDSVAAANKK